ncbi:MAG: PLP-dependent transferase, partial [Alphaproteobacteria bacterium]|nr:PLP-dependent transferase [Alphaproteobacteria bacterium]
TGLNVDVGPWADLVATSLTKNFAGHGDVMGGALVISPASPHAAALAERIAATFEDLLWWEDAVVLDRRSRSFAERMRSINTHTLDVARFLADHPAVEEVYYPGLEPDPNYEAIRRADGGYGGLFSFLPRNAAETSQPVYDRLRISKGPSLGTDYTLCCPYTILAHYAELDWAEACGVSRWLIRVSIGLEDPQDIKARFDEALKIVPR